MHGLRSSTCTPQLRTDEPLAELAAYGYGRVVLLLRRPRPAAGEGLHGLLDAGNVSLDVLHVQAPGDNLIVSDLEQRHPAHLKALPIAAGARPAPFGPGHFTVLDGPADFGVEVRDPREHGLPVGEHL